MEPQETIHVRLQIGSGDGSRFAEFWNNERHAGNLPEDVAATAEFRQAKRPLGGLGLAVPPRSRDRLAEGLGNRCGVRSGSAPVEEVTGVLQQAACSTARLTNNCDRPPRTQG